MSLKLLAYVTGLRKSRKIGCEIIQTSAIYSDWYKAGGCEHERSNTLLEVDIEVILN